MKIRPIFLPVALLLSFLLVHITPAQAANGSQPPNLVLIVTDDQGLDSVSAYGNTAIRTPNIDSLAAQGTRFTRGFASASSCSVSRSVLLSGLHGHTSGMYGHVHAYHHFSVFDEIKALPVRLEEKGYRTARIGKYHLAPAEVFRFQEDLGQGKGSPGHPISRSTVEMADASLGFIRQNPEQPFFLYFAPLDPHRGHPNSTTEPNSFGNRPDGYPGAPPEIYDPGEVAVPYFLPDLPGVRLETAEYYRSVSRIDKGVGRLVEILKETGNWDNTVIIYLADNGYAQPNAKTTLYDSGARLPLIIRTPDQAGAGSVSDALFSWVDITPTLLDYAQALDDPGAFNGVTQRPVLNGEKDSMRTEVFGSHTFHEITMYYPMRMIRTEQYKLIWNPAAALAYPTASDSHYSLTRAEITAMDQPMLGRRSWEDYRHRDVIELYDVRNDPDEVNNLASHSDYIIIRDQMIEKLKKFQEETKDPWIVKWEYE